ncbi:hypothetical protein CAXC1_280004 [Candidatus Xenohaliotis californiensis]|uniref:Uncharacterized protein n=1 Tax=Candidatus Xenohaliotis californiensis TaxID=84677 RepID=A0ABP0EW38_9RICK|nr:hypothetical protein CAXC1_280004 [Candidatus Xenohaliotis californiensis]
MCSSDTMLDATLRAILEFFKYGAYIIPKKITTMKHTMISSSVTRKLRLHIEHN